MDYTSFDFMCMMTSRSVDESETLTYLMTINCSPAVRISFNNLLTTCIYSRIAILNCLALYRYCRIAFNKYIPIHIYI